MRINYNVKGTERKELVEAISEFVVCKAEYQGAPSFAYKIGSCLVDKNGTLEIPDVKSIIAESLIEDLAKKGFTAENSVEEIERKDEPQQIALTIQLPKETFTPEAVENLNKLLEAKGTLIQKALGIEELPEAIDEGDKISFPWFKVEPNGVGMVEAYGKLVCALCDMARNQKRVTAKEQHPTNERYAFRCFLLRLGFIGQDYKAIRKALLRNLTGNAAFRDGAKHENA